MLPFFVLLPCSTHHRQCTALYRNWGSLLCVRLYDSTQLSATAGGGCPAAGLAGDREPNALTSLAEQSLLPLPFTLVPEASGPASSRTFCGLCKETRLSISPLPLWDLSSSDLLGQFPPIMLLSFQTWAALVAFLSCCLCSLCFQNE